MTLLAQFDTAGTVLAVWHTPETVAARIVELAVAVPGLAYERWPVAAGNGSTDDPQRIYAKRIDAVSRAHGVKTMDRVRLTPYHPERTRLRTQFLAEHVHDDFEMRFFASGRGLFFIRHGNAVFGLLCCAGDLISLPAGTPHWFDTGMEPDFDALRFFTRPEGWVGKPTGGDTSAYPLLEDFALAVLG